MLQSQHTKQIAQMEGTNKTNMDAMMEQMNALVAVRDARHAHQPDKVNTPPGSNVIPLGGGTQAKKPRQKKALCPNCKCFVMHKLVNYFELEGNKAARYPRMEVYLCCASNPVTGTGDITTRSRSNAPTPSPQAPPNRSVG